MITVKDNSIILGTGLPEIEYEGSTTFRSYCEFEKEIKEILDDLFIPKLNKYLDGVCTVALNRAYVQIKTEAASNMVRRPNSQYSIENTTELEKAYIKCNFSISGRSNDNINYGAYDHEADDVTLMKVPFVDSKNRVHVSLENGVSNSSKEYHFIQLIELAPSISVKEKQISIKFKSGNTSVIYCGSNGKCFVKFTKEKKFPFVPIMIAYSKEVARRSGVSIQKWEEVLSEYTRSITNITALCNDDHAILEDPSKYTLKLNADELRATVGEFFNSHKLNTDILRSNLNDALSLYNAEGEVLSRDITDNNGTVIIKKGTLLTKDKIDLLYAHNIFKVQVCVTEPITLYASRHIFIRHLKKGLKNNELIEEYTGEKGMYLSRDYELETPIVIAKDQEIDHTLYKMLQECSLNMDDPNSFRITKTGKTSFNYNFEREIISNYQKPVGDGKWEYISPLGCKEVNETNTLTLGDLFALYSLSCQIKGGYYQNYFADPDATFNKIFTPLKLIYKRGIDQAVTKFFNEESRRLSKLKVNPYLLKDNNEVNSLFFRISQIFNSKLLKDFKCLEPLGSNTYSNPIIFDSSRRKANVYVKDKHAISDDQRKMALASYGRLDQYEVPQSSNLGIVSYTTAGLRQTSDGIPLVGFYKVIKEGNKYFLDMNKNNIRWMTAIEEAQYVITDISSISVSPDGIILSPDDYVICRVPDKGTARSTLETKKVSEVQYVVADPDATIGYATGVSPFVCSDDAARSTFAVAQIEACKPILNADIPSSISVMYSKLQEQDSPFIIRAEEDGYIVEICDAPNTYNGISINVKVNGVEGGKGIKSYRFWGDLDAGEAFSRVRCCKFEGEAYKKGDILAYSEFFDEAGNMKLGAEALVLYMIDGYNYEDGISISKKFAHKMRSCSVHTESIVRSKSHPKVIDSPSKYYSKNMGRNLKYQLGEVMYNRVDCLNSEGYLYRQIVEKDDGISSLSVKLLSYNDLKKGDKISDRDGNKGVVAMIHDDWDMPILENGYVADILRNPLGVATRLNIGQLHVLQCGWIYKLLGMQVVVSTFAHSIEDEEVLFDYVQQLTSTDNFQEVFKKFNFLPKEIHERALSRKSIIDEWHGILNPDCSVNVYVHGEKYPGRVFAGFVHTLKLIQEVSAKVAYRGGITENAPYVHTSASPTKGRSAQGGQRYGTMEISALIAYNAQAFLNELFQYRSDDPVGRLNFVEKNLGVGKGNEPHQRRALTTLLSYLAAMGVKVESTSKSFIPLLENQNGELNYPKNFLENGSSDIWYNRVKKEYKDDEIKVEKLSDEKFNEIIIMPEAASPVEIASGTEKARYWIRPWFNDDEEMVDLYIKKYRELHPEIIV